MPTQFLKLGFEDLVISEKGFHNIAINGSTVGFNLDLRVNYYRGMPVSCIDVLEITVDGEKIPPYLMLFNINEKYFPVSQLPQLSTEYWGVKEYAHVRVFNYGLKPGMHKVAVRLEYRSPYMSFGPGIHAMIDGSATKELPLGEEVELFTGIPAPEKTDIPASFTPAVPAKPVPITGDIDLGVSLYGFTQRFVEEDGYNFEEMFQDLNRLGIRKFEIVGAQMFRNYPTPTEDEVQTVLRLAKRYHVEPFSYGGYVDFAKCSDHDMSDEEMMNEVVFDLMTAKRLGCKYIRGSGIPVHLYPAVANMAAFYGVTVCYEIHAPQRPSDPEIQELCRIFKELDSPWVGFVPDFGCYIERPNQLHIDRLIGLGAKPELLDFIIENRWNGYNEASMNEKVAAMGGGLAEKMAVSEWFGFMSFAPADLEGFKAVLPYAKYFHAKFYHIGEDCVETTIPYEKLIGLIKESGFKGTLMIEYEGHSFYLNDAIEQIGRHICMEQRILSE